MSNINYLLYCTDANYWMALYVSLYSLLKNNLDSKFKVFIISDSKDETFFNNLAFLKDFNNLIEVQHIQPDLSHLKNVPVSQYITIASYYRILLSHLLPENIKSILYLDCDTIIESSISEIFGKNIDNYALSAATDCEYIKNNIRLNLPKDAKYFNSGVLLINLEKWRSTNVEDRLFAYIKKDLENIIYHDQDILNAVLYNEWAEFNLKFNFQEFNSKKISFAKKYPNVRPSIIHFLGKPKPWFYMSVYPHKKRFWAYLKETPYRDYREPDRNFKKWVAKKPKLHRLLKMTKKIFVRKEDHKLTFKYFLFFLQNLF